ncbi:hypothetical protein JL722_533 [Aureococcus anophagefferens]|nr:hypothetical protein JL722_533 [Aureococcus anophagefferens]
MAMNQRVQKILLELMRERHSLYAGFTDVELKASRTPTGTGDVAALYRAPRPRAGDGGDGDGRGEAADAAGFPGLGAYAAGEAGAFDRGAKRYRTDGAEEERGGGEPSKKKRHRPSRDRARERIERRVPLTREGVDSLDWNEACEYAKSMGVSKKSHDADAARDARAVVRWQRAGPTAPGAPDGRAPRPRRRGAARALSPGTSSRAKRTAPHEGYSSDEADDHPRPPRVVAADTIEPSSDEDDDEADAAADGRAHGRAARHRPPHGRRRRRRP